MALKVLTAFAFYVACSNAVLSVRKQSLIPVADQAELIRQRTGGEIDRGMDKTAGCQLLPGCPDIECLEPFVLQRAEGQCCPTCEAPVELVDAAIHTSMRGPSPWAAPLSPTAPSGCEGVKCFIPVCKAGEEVGPFPGSCCKACIPAAGSSSARTREVGYKIR